MQWNPSEEELTGLFTAIFIKCCNVCTDTEKASTAQAHKLRWKRWVRRGAEKGDPINIHEETALLIPWSSWKREIVRKQSWKSIIYKFCPLRGRRSKWCKLHLETEEKMYDEIRADAWGGRKMPVSPENNLGAETVDNVDWNSALIVCPQPPTSPYPKTSRNQSAKHLRWLHQHGKKKFFSVLLHHGRV